MRNLIRYNGPLSLINWFACLFHSLFEIFKTFVLAIIHKQLKSLVFLI